MPGNILSTLYKPILLLKEVDSASVPQFSDEGKEHKSLSNLLTIIKLKCDGSGNHTPRQSDSGIQAVNHYSY